MAGLEPDDQWEAAAGFGGGMAGKQDVCGSISGGIVGCGLLTARRTGLGRAQNADLRKEVYRQVGALYDKFLSQFGAVECRVLSGYDFSQRGAYKSFREDPEARKRCNSYKTLAIETLGELEDAK